jgi:hypothetical protein
METTRRGFFGLVAAVAAFVGVKQAPLFADHVRQSVRKMNRSGDEHTERQMSAVMPYTALEDAAAFHAIAERQRLAMIAELRTMGAPINVWRVGMCNGVVAVPVNRYTGMPQPWRDEHIFTVRVRCSVETPPFAYPDYEAAE